MGSIPITRSDFTPRFDKLIDRSGNRACRDCGSVAQRQSRGLITPWLQVRILSDPHKRDFYRSKTGWSWFFCAFFPAKEFTYLHTSRAGTAFGLEAQSGLRTCQRASLFVIAIFDFANLTPEHMFYYHTEQLSYFVNQLNQARLNP
jgi:hypothetical protein